jgi:hypothetical protein
MEVVSSSLRVKRNLYPYSFSLILSIFSTSFRFLEIILLQPLSFCQYKRLKRKFSMRRRNKRNPLMLLFLSRRSGRQNFLREFFVLQLQPTVCYTKWQDKEDIKENTKFRDDVMSPKMFFLALDSCLLFCSRFAFHVTSWEIFVIFGKRAWWDLHDFHSFPLPWLLIPY